MMWQFLFLLGLIFVSPLAGFFFVQKKNPHQKWLSGFLGLAAGTFVFLFISENLRELWPWNGTSWSATGCLILGFAFNFLLDHLLPEHEHHQHDHCHHPGKMCHLATMTTVSLGVHNIIEGTAFGVLAASDMAAAVLLAAMVILHNIPLNMALIAPETYIKSGKGHLFKHLFWANFPFVVGAMSYFVMSGNLPEVALMWGEFFVFGMIIYLLIHEIWPIAWQEGGKKNAVVGAIGGGILVALIELVS